MWLRHCGSLSQQCILGWRWHAQKRASNSYRIVNGQANRCSATCTINCNTAVGDYMAGWWNTYFQWRLVQATWLSPLSTINPNYPSAQDFQSGAGRMSVPHRQDQRKQAAGNSGARSLDIATADGTAYGGTHSDCSKPTRRNSDIISGKTTSKYQRAYRLSCLVLALGIFASVESPQTAHQAPSSIILGGIATPRSLTRS